ncbi:MAG: iron dependent repressor, metal binding and dimerization domain protein [Lawsonella sp.]
MKELVDTTQMYLKTIFELEEEGITPLRARIAERLEQSGPTVSQTVARMERDGLLTVEPNRELKFTEKGRSIATAVMRKHRLAERMLTDIIGMDLADIHEEACKWEHVMGEDVERHLIRVLDHPTTSPYGNPIPGLEEISSETASPRRYPQLTDIELSDNVPMVVTLRQVGEVAQADQHISNALDINGIAPGSRVNVREVDGSIEICSLGGDWIKIPDDIAHAFYVEPLKR